MDNLNQPFSAQNQPTTEQQQSISLKSSSHSKALLIAFVFFILLFASLTALILGSRIRSTSQPPQSTIKQPSPTPLPAETSVKEGNPTANWKTHTDVANGFSIKYPENWNEFSVADESGGYLLKFVLTPQSREPLDEKAADYSPGVHIGVLKMKKCLDSANHAQTEVNTYLKNKDLYPGLDIHLLNLTGIHGYRINNGSPGPTAQRGPEVYIFNCKIEIQIGLDPAGIENSGQLFDQILSTFKFTNQDQIVCTQDAKLCPDGSYVSRQPPNCEFAKCP